MNTFDLAIIGAGPGGFEAALRARELGFKVALIDKSNLGGTCLNSGCIPTKSLLASTKFLTKIQSSTSYGLPPLNFTADWSALTQRENRIVETLKKGMTETLKRSGVEWITGQASFLDKNQLLVSNQKVEAETILIATGTEPTSFMGKPFGGEAVFSSTDILQLKSIPKHLLIIGGGVIGVEFASIFQALGVKVTLVEMLERLIATEEEEVSRRLESLFRRKGIEIYTGEKVKGFEVATEGLKNGAPAVRAELESGKIIHADQCLVAIGRKPRLESLGLDKAAVKIEKGTIWVDEYLQTSVPGIFAIGDVTNRTTGLAHGAAAEGIRVVENLKRSKKIRMDYGAIPNCIYSDPEVASVGIYQSQSKKPSEGIVESKILFSSIGKSQVEGETEGFIKMAAAKKDGRILGVTAIGAHVTELIHEAVLAIHAGLDARTLSETIHAHPTESEVLQKAARLILERMN